MNKSVKNRSFYIFAGALSFALLGASCSKSKVIASLEEEQLFSLQYGSFENQINLFDLADVGEINTTMAMENGFFYIANGESKKIIETNSYGDLLSVYYNEDSNPAPAFAEESKNAGATKMSIAYPFNEISTIAVDNRKYVYVVDKLPIERQERDSETQQLMSQIVLRFDGEGKFVDYLGQQGPGGTPFPFIIKIYATDNNELVVVCKTGQGMIVYWFSTAGYLLYTVPFDPKNIPNPYQGKTQTDNWFTVDNIIPDHSKRTLYVKVDYSASYVDAASRVQSGIDYEETLLYPLSVEDGTYDNPITIPPYTEQVVSGLSSVSYDIPYDFIGVTDSGWFFFLVSTENGYTVQMVQPNGQKILRRALRVDHSKCLYNTFSLSDNGILSALFAQKDKVIVDWWRTDSLIAAVIKN